MTSSSICYSINEHLIRCIQDQGRHPSLSRLRRTTNQKQTGHYENGPRAPQLQLPYILAILDHFEHDRTKRIKDGFTGHKTEEGRPTHAGGLTAREGDVVTFQSGPYFAVCEIEGVTGYTTLREMVRAKGPGLIPWGTFTTRVADYNTLYPGQENESWCAFKLKLLEYKFYKGDQYLICCQCGRSVLPPSTRWVDNIGYCCLKCS
jgi:ASC-1-like (ASCH) protein